MSALRALAVALAALAAAFAHANPGVALVTRDQTPLRAAPRDSAPSSAVLWQGEALEVRGERLDYLQVWDHARERGGFVHASQVRRAGLAEADAPELLALLRFLRDTPGSEALGIGYAAAYIEAAPPETLSGGPGIEALDALGTLSDRLARRASSGGARTKSEQAVLSAHLDVAARYGVKFASYERDGRVHLCYDGDAWRRVLAMRAGNEQRARAALALTREECIAPALGPHERGLVDDWRAETLDTVDASALPPVLKNRVLMRRAGVWSALAYRRTREHHAADFAAHRALAALEGVVRADLTDGDRQAYAEAAMRVNASRWAAAPARAAGEERRPRLDVVPGRPGETCVSLIDEDGDARHPLVRRCTYGVVWTASAALNPEWTALALAVQPTETWRELWVFALSAQGWTVGVLPPAATTPGVGYAEFAGWVPGGRKMLVAREARGEGKYRLRFEVIALGTLATEQQASDSRILHAFRRWQDASWKRETLSLR
ncbi:MAG TPA: hypothetical protein VLV56_12475 [Burkholderiales bacterium]|nr:hypothetical protein [Burkholderiales bacterium]